MIFLVLLRTGSNPADIYWFRSHTGKKLSCTILMIFCYFDEKKGKLHTANDIINSPRPTITTSRHLVKLFEGAAIL